MRLNFYALFLTAILVPAVSFAGDIQKSSDGVYTNSAARRAVNTVYKTGGVYKNRDAGRSLSSPYDVQNPGYVSGSVSADPIYVRLASGETIDLMSIIETESAKYNIDPYLVRTVIKFESGFNPYATSPVGAGGLMQLMPDTARGLGVSDIYSPYQNIAGGVLYLKYQLDAFNNNIAFALAAYNAGPGAVKNYGGVPPYKETINYVNGILADYSQHRRPVAKKQHPADTQPQKTKHRKIDKIKGLEMLEKLSEP